jgi:alanyl-tRNA synthetase
MALFGEKYGDVVRVVEVSDGSFSRELCGGTHVRSTAEIGLVKILSQTSSASNVRRIEALAGPPAVRIMRREDELLREAARLLRKPIEEVPVAVAELQTQIKAAQKATSAPQLDIRALADDATSIGVAKMLTATLPPVDPRSLPDIADRLKGQLGESVVVLATAVDGRVSLVASVTPALVETGLKADDLVKLAAAIVGGGGGGRPTMAQAGGKDPSRIEDALEAVRNAVRLALSNP